jgi:flagellar biosynthesis/type III secretory pathway protein FliH
MSKIESLKAEVTNIAYVAGLRGISLSVFQSKLNELIEEVEQSAAEVAYDTGYEDGYSEALFDEAYSE